MGFGARARPSSPRRGGARTHRRSSRRCARTCSARTAHGRRGATGADPGRRGAGVGGAAPAGGALGRAAPPRAHAALRAAAGAHAGEGDRGAVVRARGRGGGVSAHGARFPLAGGRRGVLSLRWRSSSRGSAGSWATPRCWCACVRRSRARRTRGPDPPSTFVGSPPELGASHAPTGDRWTGVAASPGRDHGHRAGAALTPRRRRPSPRRGAGHQRRRRGLDAAVPRRLRGGDGARRERSPTRPWWRASTAFRSWRTWAARPTRCARETWCASTARRAWWSG
jgi:hypothetical protein